MEEKKLESPEKSTESRPPEKKDYHAPELTVYGDMRELTLTNPLASGRDNFAEATAPI